MQPAPTTDPQIELLARIDRERGLLAGTPRTQAVKRTLRILRKLRTFVREDRHKPTPLAWRHALRAWRHGFLRFHYRLYGLDTGGDPRDYVSDLSAYLTHDRINGRFTELINNKYTFGRMLNLLGMPVPGIRGLIVRGAFYPLDSSQVLTPTAFLSEAFAEGTALALRPIWGYHGYGFIGLRREGTEFHLNGVTVDAGQLAQLFGGLDEYLVSEFVEQGAFSRALYPPTVNTIRIVTLSDGDRPFIARAVLRIGTSRSFPVDNFKAGHGGLSALIDPESGRLGPGALADAGGKPEWHARHPESGAPIAGVVIPGWVDLCQKMLDCAGRLAFIRSFGWDVVLTDHGFSILEGNSKPGMPVLQVHGPLLTDPRVRRFYQSL